MDGNKSVMQMLKSGNMPTRSFMFAVAGTSVVAPSLPSLDAGFQHPCRNDGFSTLVYNDENSGLGTLILQAPAWPFLGKLELQKPHSQAGAWKRVKFQLKP